MSLVAIDVLPAPDGEDSTYIKPLRSMPFELL